MLDRICFLTAIVLGQTSVALCQTDRAWPIPQWQTTSPATVKMRAAKLNDVQQWLSCLAEGRPFGTVIIRHGRITWECYDSGAKQDSRWEIGSLRKAVASTVLGMAIDEGKDHKHYFPPPGNRREYHQERDPADVGLNPLVIDRLRSFIGQHPYARNQRIQQARWALWRNGYLVHVEGDFYKTQDVASLRKTWHAMIVGAALQQGKIPSLQQTLSAWVKGLQGRDAKANWWHVITQSAGFDYPYDNWPDFDPGQMWTYSDWNLVHLCQALARVYGKQGFHDDYQDVAAQAYFDTIGMKGWSTRIKKDAGFSGPSDGVRFVLNLEHMGRLGLLALARGSWAGKQLIPRWFVEELESKQTYGMRVNYQGPNDGKISLSPEEFPECPYGYLTWTNTDQDLYPGASRRWANGRGAGGTVILWHHGNGIVFAGAGIQLGFRPISIPLVIERHIIPHP